MPVIDYSLPDAPPEQHIHGRKAVVAAFESVSGVIKAAVAPLPTQTGDGSSIPLTKPTGALDDLIYLHPRDILTLAEVAKETITGDPVNDRTFLMERLVKLASELPPTSKNRARISNSFVQQLYDDLQHPPVSILGNQHEYRAADGSFNVRTKHSHAYLGHGSLLHYPRTQIFSRALVPFLQAIPIQSCSFISDCNPC